MTKVFARLTALAALSLLLVAPSGASAAKLPSEFFGVVNQNPLEDQDIARMKQLNAGTMRFQIHWRSIEATDDVFNWTEMDRLVGGSAKANVVAIPYTLGVPDRLSNRETRPPIDTAFQRAEWQEFHRELVKRYGAGGEYWRDPALFKTQFPGTRAKPVKIWQVWNEPSSTTYWAGKANPRQYAKLVKLAAQAVRQIDGNAKIMLAGVCCSPRGGIDAWIFLRKLYQVAGIEKFFDYVALHPYAPGVKGTRAQIELAREEIKKAGDGNVKIWLTEFGWASGGNHPNLTKTPQGQAKILRDSFNVVLKNRNKWNIAGLTWFALRDAGGSSTCPFCQYMGLLTHQFDPKPAWFQFKKFSSRQR